VSEPTLDLQTELAVERLELQSVTQPRQLVVLAREHQHSASDLARLLSAVELVLHAPLQAAQLVFGYFMDTQDRRHKHHPFGILERG